jgi:hypothetical protein
VSVSVIISYFDGCPGWQTARANLEVAARRVGVEVDVSLERVETVGDAERLGFSGSPTAEPLAIALTASPAGDE